MRMGLFMVNCFAFRVRIGLFEDKEDNITVIKITRSFVIGCKSIWTAVYQPLRLSLSCTKKRFNVNHLLLQNPSPKLLKLLWFRRPVPLSCTANQTRRRRERTLSLRNQYSHHHHHHHHHLNAYSSSIHPSRLPFPVQVTASFTFIFVAVSKSDRIVRAESVSTHLVVSAEQPTTTTQRTPSQHFQSAVEYRFCCRIQIFIEQRVSRRVSVTVSGRVRSVLRVQLSVFRFMCR